MSLSNNILCIKKKYKKISKILEDELVIADMNKVGHAKYLELFFDNILFLLLYLPTYKLIHTIN